MRYRAKAALSSFLILGIPVAVILYLAGGVTGAATAVLVTAAVTVPASLLRAPSRRRQRR
jgi:hypothetical protein